MPDDGHRYELVRGRLRKSSPLTHLQGRIAARIALSLFEHVSAHNLGEVFPASIGFQLASIQTTCADRTSRSCSESAC